MGREALALIHAGFAQGKNRRGLVWFLILALLGPIARLILVLITGTVEPVVLQECRLIDSSW